jgi:hypothetical protein
LNVRLLNGYSLAAGLSSVVLLCPLASAETVYKHVDPEGNVTFSSNPSRAGPGEAVVPIEIDPRLSEEQRKAAQERLDALQREAARLEREREIEQEERAERVASAQVALREARAALEEAKKKTLDDWQYLFTGGRVLKQSYFDRVEAAEQRVSNAKKALRRAQGESP